VVGSCDCEGAENQEVCIAFSPNFERIWLEAKKRLPEYVSQKPANLGLKSQYALRLYSWAKKYVTVGKKGISLEQLRNVLGLESIKTPKDTSSKKRLYSYGRTFANDRSILRWWRSPRKRT
jgi:plasmid replication initiation protein